MVHSTANHVGNWAWAIGDGAPSSAPAKSLSLCPFTCLGEVFWTSRLLALYRDSYGSGTAGLQAGAGPSREVFRGIPHALPQRDPPPLLVLPRSQPEPKRLCAGLPAVRHAALLPHARRRQHRHLHATQLHPEHLQHQPR